MENKLKSESEISKEVEKIHREIQPALYEFNKEPKDIYAGNESDLNAKILEITMKIKDQYPELSKYIDEMSVTIPDEKAPQITLKNLRTYYDSLNTVLNTYIKDHPAGKK